MILPTQIKDAQRIIDKGRTHIFPNRPEGTFDLHYRFNSKFIFNSNLTRFTAKLLSKVKRFGPFNVIHFFKNVKNAILTFLTFCTLLASIDS